jgi:hypothetical protein
LKTKRRRFQETTNTKQRNWDKGYFGYVRTRETQVAIELPDQVVDDFSIPAWCHLQEQERHVAEMELLSRVFR